MCSMKKCLINRLLRPRECGCGTSPEQTLVDQSCNGRNGEEPNQGPFVLFAPCLHCSSNFFALQRSLALFSTLRITLGKAMGWDPTLTSQITKDLFLVALYGICCQMVARGGHTWHDMDLPTTWRSASQIQHFIFGIWFSLVSCFRAGRARANLMLGSQDPNEEVDLRGKIRY